MAQFKGISTDLQTVVNEMCKVRKAFVDLKIENSALFKQSEKQKLQINKSKNRCQKLMDLFTAKYKNIMETSAGLKSEVKYLRQVVEDLQSQLTSQTSELKTKDDLFARLEEEMEVLRSQIDLQANEHQKDIENLLDRNRIQKTREIAQHQTKLDFANAEIQRLKERLTHQTEHKNKSRKRYSHPALSDSETDNSKGKSLIKRKKNQNNSFRWSQLNISSSKTEESPKPLEQSTKKKKLFLLDTDTIVDLETP